VILGNFLKNQEIPVLVKIGLQYINTTLKTACVFAHISSVAYKYVFKQKIFQGCREKRSMQLMSSTFF
jgi:hypothetical protein